MEQRTRKVIGRRGGRGRGQSLVEFAISFPVVMLMILFGVDFGRVFVGWLSLSNAVREAANYAAINPTAWSDSNTEAIAEYNRLITAEAGGNTCTLPATLPSPSFPSGSTIGSPAVVAITCRFSLITPLMTNFFGGGVDVSAAASFPIRSGLLGGSGFSAGLPSFSPGPGATASPAATIPPAATVPPAGTAPPAPTATPGPTPTPPPCFVPNLIAVNTSQATKRWTDAGFSANNLTFSPLVPPNYKIRTQSVPADGQPVACTATLKVTP